MQIWYIAAVVTSLMLSAVFTICFSQISVRQIKQKIKASGAYFISSEERIGFTLFCFAFAVIFPTKIARTLVPPAFLDVKLAKSFGRYPRDKILGSLFLISITAFSTLLLSYNLIKTG